MATAPRRGWQARICAIVRRVSCILVLAGCGAAAAPSAAAGRPIAAPGSAALPGPNALESLTDYAFKFSAGGLTVAGEVHSPTDWQVDQPLIERHVDGFIYSDLYSDLGGKWYRQAEGSNTYQQSPYLSAIRNFLGFLRIAGARAARGKACAVAGAGGHAFTIGSATLNSQALSEQARASIADSGGALLGESVGASGSLVPGGTHSLTYDFAVTSIGNVPVLAVPSPVQAG